MSEFWWGVLALPIIAVAVAAAVGAVIGAWILIDKWSVDRWSKLPPVELPVKFSRPWGGGGWTPGYAGKRGAYTSLLLTTMKGFTIRITSGIAIQVIYGGGKLDIQRSKLLLRALEKAMVDVSEEAANASSNGS